MEQFNQDIFQQLVSDIAFIRWAKGKKVPDAEHWKEWVAHHPEYSREFQEALQLVKSLSFNIPQVKEQDIRYLWKETSSRFPGSGSLSKIKRLLTHAAKVAAILFIPLLVYTGWIQWGKGQVEGKYADLVDIRSKQNISVVSPIGSKTIVNLPDGSRAWLNAGSKITYPAYFHGNTRRVRIEGEVFFKVQKSKTPFIVQNIGPEVKVYGTQFNVNAYKNECDVTVALVKGKVSLKLKGGERFLAPGQVSFYNKEKKTMAIKDADVTPFVCWREGKYIFRNTPLNSILRTLQRQYNVTFTLADPSLGSYNYDAILQSENLEQILEMLQISAPIKCKYVKGSLGRDGTFLKGKVMISKDKSRKVKR